jgi:activating signal cointegrator 1
MYKSTLMKALSLYQPFATLVVLGKKRCETRGWHTEYRGPLLIHASRTFPEAARELCRREPVRRLLTDAGIRDSSDLRRGALLGTVHVRNCVPAEEVDVSALRDLEQTLGDFGPGRWIWVLEQAARLVQPLPYLGRPGVFDVPDDLLIPY